jgi:uncharacterized phage protein (TIGR02220 family)
MSGIGLSVTDLQQDDLSLREIVLLKIIYEKEKEMFKIICKEPKNDVSLQNLEAKGYVKILSDNPTIEDIALRANADKIVEQSADKSTAILEYLNSKIVGDRKKGFSLVSPANRKFINARLSEGYTIQDLKDVIDLKVKDWKGTKYEDYLRPETLFNSTKFQTYYVVSQKKKSNLNGDEDWSIGKV